MNEDENPFEEIDPMYPYHRGLKIIKKLQADEITIIEATEKYFSHVRMHKKAIYRFLRIIKRSGKNSKKER